MYGAVPYLASAFGIDRNESFRIVCEWIDAQEALAADSTTPKAIVPKTVVPAERAAAPTLFDPVPPAAPAAKPARPSTLDGARQRASFTSSPPLITTGTVSSRRRLAPMNGALFPSAAPSVSRSGEAAVNEVRMAAKAPTTDASM